MLRTSRMVAATLTLLGLGALTAYALQPATSRSAAPQPVVVRTETIKRTIRVVRHENTPRPHLPRIVAAAAPPAPAVRTGAVSGASATYPTAGSASPRPVSTRTSAATNASSGTASRPATRKPVTTRTSGAGTKGEPGDGSDHRGD